MLLRPRRRQPQCQIPSQTVILAQLYQANTSIKLAPTLLSQDNLEHYVTNTNDVQQAILGIPQPYDSICGTFGNSSTTILASFLRASTGNLLSLLLLCLLGWFAWPSLSIEVETFVHKVRDTCSRQQKVVVEQSDESEAAIWVARDLLSTPKLDFSKSGLYCQASRDLVKLELPGPADAVLCGVWQHDNAQRNGLQSSHECVRQRSTNNGSRRPLENQSFALSATELSNDDLNTEVDFGRNIVLNDDGDDRPIIRGIPSSSTLQSSRHGSDISGDDLPLIIHGSASENIIDLPRDRGPTAVPGMHVAALPTASDSSGQSAEPMEGIRGPSDIATPGSSSNRTDPMDDFTRKALLLLTKALEVELDGRKRFICPIPNCKGTNATISEMIKSLQTSHGKSFCKNCCDFLRRIEDDTQPRESTSGKRRRDEASLTKVELLNDLWSSHREEGCNTYCILERCAAQGRKSNITSKHIQQSRCGKTTWSSIDSMERYCYIFALLHDKQSPPHDYYLEVPETLHHGVEYVRSTRKVSANTKTLESRIETLAQENEQLKEQVEALSSAFREQDAQHQQLMQRNRWRSNLLVNQFFRLVQSHSIPLPRQIVQDVLAYAPDLATEVNTYASAQSQIQSQTTSSTTSTRAHMGNLVTSQMQPQQHFQHSNYAQFGRTHERSSDPTMLLEHPTTALPGTYHGAQTFAPSSESVYSNTESSGSSSLPNIHDAEYTDFQRLRFERQGGGSLANNSGYNGAFRDEEMSFERTFNVPGRYDQDL